MRAALVVIDPLMAFLSGTVNSHRDQDVRRALAPLAALGDETGAAIVVCRHLNKGSGGNPLYRGGGSIGIVGAARAAMLVAEDPEDKDLRVLAPIKSNLAKPVPSLAFALTEAANGAVRVEWKGESAHSADALLTGPLGSEERSALDEAEDFLKEILDSGPVRANQVIEEAREADISEITLKRAKKDLGVRSRKEAEGFWVWLLPETKEINEDRSTMNDPLDPLGSPKTPGCSQRLQEDQGDQGDSFEEDEVIAGPGRALRPDGRCIHEVLGGCWLCKNKSAGNS